MKSILLLLLAAVSFSGASVQTLPDVNDLVWKTVTFGQSTDVNFATNVLPDKIGINQVTLANGQPVPSEGGKLITPVDIESRGGKIGNSHDGLTFYYTRLPANANMQLDAEIYVEQFGPENGALPAGQEGAGLLVRDILGQPRLEKVQPGYEEFPAASNMVMNAIMTQDKTSHHKVQISMISRNGVVNSWGNAGVEIKRQPYKHDLDINKTPSFKLRLVRSDDGFESSWAPIGTDDWVIQKTGGTERITKLDKEGYYVGFFASRNARITVKQANLTMSEHQASKDETFVAQPLPAKIEIASAGISATPEYNFQLRSNQSGKLTVAGNGTNLVTQQPVAAGEMQSIAVLLGPKQTLLSYQFVTEDGQNLSDVIKVEPIKLADPANIFVSPNGTLGNDGSNELPLDMETALAAVVPGGTVWLINGDYPLTTLPATVSSTPQKLKKLRPLGKNVEFHGLNLEASYWDIQGISVTTKSFNISGSHNLIDRVVAHHADDTGIWVASPAGIGRPLWASHNVISNSESYGNRDPGRINADGFAVKMRVGEGNKLISCFSHDNIDDGYDLFNKIEDGPNGQVTIENSIALRNVNNGFKLGGEGLPVAHQVSNSLAIENGMDGFTDNFNPGALVVRNNTAIDNKRFNFIFRPGPYTQSEKQGIFEQNISLRSRPAEYADAVVGQINDNNIFIQSDVK